MYPCVCACGAQTDKGFKQSLRRVKEKAKEERAERAKVWKGKLPPVEPKSEEEKKKKQQGGPDDEKKRSWREWVVDEWPTMFGIPVIAGALGVAMYRDFSYNGFY